MKLYYNPLSTYCQKVMIAFNEKGITYEPIFVNLMTPEGRAAYEKTNPLGKLPFLKPSDDWQVPVTELLFQQAGFRGKDEDKAARSRKYIAMSYAHWDTRLASQQWMCGNDFSMADCAAIPSMFYAQMAAPFEAFANVTAYWRRAQERASYVKVRAEFEPIWNNLMAARAA